MKRIRIIFSRIGAWVIWQIASDIDVFIAPFVAYLQWRRDKLSKRLGMTERTKRSNWPTRMQITMPDLSKSPPEWLVALASAVLSIVLALGGVAGFINTTNTINGVDLRTSLSVATLAEDFKEFKIQWQNEIGNLRSEVGRIAGEQNGLDKQSAQIRAELDPLAETVAARAGRIETLERSMAVLLDRLSVENRPQAPR